MNRRLLLLTLCQGFFLTNNVTFIAINGLVGLRLAPSAVDCDACRSPPTSPAARCSPALVGAAPARLGPAARVPARPRWSRSPRRRCARWAASQRTVSGCWCRRDAVAGYYNANAGLVPLRGRPRLVAPAFKERAISWVLAGGILGAVAGPNLARCDARRVAGRVRRRLCRAGSSSPLLSLLTISFIRFPPLVAADAPPSRARPLARDRGQPVFIVAVVRLRARLRRDEPADGGDADRDGACARIRSTTPRWCSSGTCSACSCRASSPARLIRALRRCRVMAVGVAARAASASRSRCRASSSMHFVLALLALGVGWNFLFIGGTTLFTEAYRPEEKTTRAGGDGHDRSSATMTITSFSSGALVTTQGWTLAQPRLDRAGALTGDRAVPGTPRTGARRLLRDVGRPSLLRTRSLRAPSRRSSSKRNSRHSIGPFHIGTRRDSFSRIALGRLHVGAEDPGGPAGRDAPV